MEISKTADKPLIAQDVISMMNSFPNPHALLDFEGKVIAMNDGWINERREHSNSIFNVGEGYDFVDFCENVKGISSNHNEIIKAGIKRLIDGEKKTFDCRLQIYFEDLGQWILLHANKIIGEFSGIMLCLARIPEDSVVEKELMESEKRFRALFEHSYDAIFIYDHTGKILDVNSTAGNMLGYRIRDLTMMTLDQIFSGPVPDSGDIVPKVKNSRVQIETELKVPGKRNLMLDIRCRVIDFQAGIVQCIARDITDSKLVLNALHKSEEKYRNIVEHASEGIVVIREGLITYINPKAAAMFEIPTGKMIHKPFMNFIHPEDRPLVDSHYRRHARGEEDFHGYTCRIVCAEGRIKWMEANGIPIEWEDSHAVLKFLTDVTQRIETETALKESEFRYKMLFEESPFTLWEEDLSETMAFARSLEQDGIHDLKSYLLKNPEILKKCFSLAKVLDVNTASVKTFQAPNKSELIKRIPTLICDEALPAFAEVLSAMQKGMSVWESEIMMPRFDGSIFPAFLKGTLATGHEGKYSKVYVSLLDLSDLKKAEQSLKESEEKFRALVEQSPMGLIITQENMIIYANEIAAKLIGCSVEELRNMHRDDLKKLRLEEDMNYAERQWMDFNGNPNVPLRFEYRVVRMDKDIRWMEFHLSKITYNGKLGTQIFFGDITERKQAEEELIRQKNLLSSVISHIPHHVFWKDRNSRYFGCNSNFAKVAGLDSPNKIVGLTDYDLPWKKEESDYYVKCDREVMNTNSGLSNIIETQLQADGTQAIVQTSKVPLRDCAGEVLGILGIYLDITEQKEAEKKLEMSHSLLRASLESAFDGILVTDLNGVIRDYNSKFFEMWEMQEESDFADGKMTIFQLLSSRLDNPDKFLNSLGDLRVFSGDGIKDLISLKNDRIFEFNSLPQVLNGKSIGRVWSFHDITDRVESERTLSQIINRYTTMIDTVPAALFAKDENLRYVVANKTLCGRMGKSRDEVVGKTDLDLSSSDLAGNLPETDRQVLDQNKMIINKEEQIAYGGGDPAWYSITKVPLKSEDGKNIGIVGLIQDITEQRRSREQLIQSDKLAAIGTLAAGVAHEINNPMGYISSNLNVMKKYIARFGKYVKETTDTESEDYEDLKEILDDFNDAVDESLEGAGRVKDIVADLKSFSRVDKVEASFADINEGIKSTLNIVWNELKYHCKVETDYGDIPELFCMANQLNQVFMNILINAGQAITHKSGLIKIKTRADDANINISITDNGSGISDENLKKIFEPFFTTKDVGKGTGLGLSLVFDIIKKHKGTIDVKSKVGEGSEFIVSLPLGGIDEG